MSNPLFDGLFGGLSGLWNLARVIEGEGATLRGKAWLLPDGPRALAYKETGQLMLSDGRTLEAYRNYRYRFDDEMIEVDFVDGPNAGKLFVRLVFIHSTPISLEAFDIHQCGNDIYRVLYRFNLPSMFETEINVSGPNKKYRAISRYNKPC